MRGVAHMQQMKAPSINSLPNQTSYPNPNKTKYRAIFSALFSFVKMINISMDNDIKTTSNVCMVDNAPREIELKRLDVNLGPIGTIQHLLYFILFWIQDFICLFIFLMNICLFIYLHITHAISKECNVDDMFMKHLTFRITEYIWLLLPQDF